MFERRRRETLVAPPPVDLLREYIAEQRCWWCEAGPYKMLAGHVSGRHGITAAELREMAVLTKKARICSPELSELFRKRPQQDGIAERARNIPRKKRRMSEAGKAINREKLLRGSNNETRRQAAHRNGDISRQYFPCSFCGKVSRRSPTWKLTCSPECRLEVRKRTLHAMMVSHGRTQV